MQYQNSWLDFGSDVAATVAGTLDVNELLDYIVRIACLDRSSVLPSVCPPRRFYVLCVYSVLDTKESSEAIPTSSPVRSRSGWKLISRVYS